MPSQGKAPNQEPMDLEGLFETLTENDSGKSNLDQEQEDTQEPVAIIGAQADKGGEKEQGARAPLEQRTNRK